MEWKLIVAEGLLRATKALEVPGGVIVRTTDHTGQDVAMCSDIVPGAKIVPTREINEIGGEQLHRLVPAYSDPGDVPDGIGSAVESATAELPKGWTLDIRIRRGDGYVKALMNREFEHHFEYKYMSNSVAKEIRNAVARARAVESSGESCPDCGGDGFESYEVGDDTPCVLCDGTGEVAP